ncbi:MAG: T9SS type A sorting domain-containing protein [Deltaproteobacteria bacterium]|nr:T9SS type A sorting domain-containing protein [Deltaproteobacteria bacterium]MBL7178557.1 T9SS type A sorting domain-containing protein [Desulfobacteraceae bacterium]
MCRKSSFIRVDFLDLSGRTCLSWKETKPVNGIILESICISRLRSGIYIVHAVGDNHVVTKHLVVF